MFSFSEKVISHRGASAFAPENTWAAFEKARQMGSRQIEFDVVLSADGVPFVFHDEYLNRTTNGVGAIGLVDSAYLRSLDAGQWFSSAYQGEKIPSFEETIDWLMTTNIHPNIEIKPFPGAIKETTKTIVTMIQRRWVHSRPWPLLSSFEREVLKLCIELAPEIPRGYLMHRWDKGWLKKAMALQCSSIHVNYKTLTLKRALGIKAEGYRLLAYTVNNPLRAETLFDWGVDAVFSDYPNLLG